MTALPHMKLSITPPEGLSASSKRALDGFTQKYNGEWEENDASSFAYPVPRINACEKIITQIAKENMSFAQALHKRLCDIEAFNCFEPNEDLNSDDIHFILDPGIKRINNLFQKTVSNSSVSTMSSSFNGQSFSNENLIEIE